MAGILVHGDNPFMVRGPLPDRDVAQSRSAATANMVPGVFSERISTMCEYTPKSTAYSAERFDRGLPMGIGDD
jgi:hypothetical protein